MAYLTFTLRRLVAVVLVALGVSAITFVMLHVLRPEVFPDPRPPPVRLGDFLWGAVTELDLGRSRQPPGRPVGELVLHGLPADLSLFAGALVFGVASGSRAASRALRPRSIRARVLHWSRFRATTGAISNGDFPLLQGLVIPAAILVVLGNLAADLLLTRLDPHLY